MKKIERKKERKKERPIFSSSHSTIIFFFFFFLARAHRTKKEAKVRNGLTVDQLLGRPCQTRNAFQQTPSRWTGPTDRQTDRRRTTTFIIIITQCQPHVTNERKKERKEGKKYILQPSTYNMKGVKRSFHLLTEINRIKRMSSSFFGWTSPMTEWFRFPPSCVLQFFVLLYHIRHTQKIYTF